MPGFAYMQLANTRVASVVVSSRYCSTLVLMTITLLRFCWMGLRLVCGFTVLCKSGFTNQLPEAFSVALAVLQEAAGAVLMPWLASQPVLDEDTCAVSEHEPRHFQGPRFCRHALRHCMTYCTLPKQPCTARCAVL